MDITGSSDSDATGDAHRAVGTLAACEPGERILSLYVRTDPRDPANTNHVPGWLVAARNHLRRLGASVERDGDREDRVALRRVTERARERLHALEGDRRGRSVALLLTPSGALDRQLALQLPVRADSALWDDLPLLSPLIDVAG